MPREEQFAVYESLKAFVDDDRLIYPKQVVEELERYVDLQRNPGDLPYQFAKSNTAKATRLGPSFDTVRRVFEHVPEVLDPDKTGAEEADPYVIALAWEHREAGAIVTVLTEDRRDRPDKMSLATACGVLGMPTLPVVTFLARQNIWPRK